MAARLKNLDRDTPEFKTYNVLHTLIDERRVRAMAEKGISVNIFTVNEEEEILRFVKAGAAGVITDFPQNIIQYKQGHFPVF